MTQHRRRVAQTVLALVALSLVGPAAAQQSPPPGDGSGKQPGALDPASKVPEDPAIPSPGALSPQTPPRAFVESFLVGLAQRTPSVVHESYLAPTLKESMPLERFVAELRDLRSAAGPLTRLSVTHLRQRNASREGEVDGGWATYLGAFERDPKVPIRVEFERGAEGLWLVTAFTIDSPQVVRLQRARDQTASGVGAPATGAPGTAKEAAEPPAAPPLNDESGGDR